MDTKLAHTFEKIAIGYVETKLFSGIQELYDEKKIQFIKRQL